MYRIGIDLGGTNIKVGLVDESQKLVSEKFTPTKSERPAEEVIADIAKTVLAVLGEQSLGVEDIAGVGVGCAGTIDAKNGEVPYSNNLGWENVPFAKLLQKYLKQECKVRISNDANCAALGEAKAGAARGIDNVVLLTLGTGVGGGVIIDGRVFEGSPCRWYGTGTYFPDLWRRALYLWQKGLCGGLCICHRINQRCETCSGGRPGVSDEPALRGGYLPHERKDSF